MKEPECVAVARSWDKGQDWYESVRGGRRDFGGREGLDRVHEASRSRRRPRAHGGGDPPRPGSSTSSGTRSPGSGHTTRTWSPRGWSTGPLAQAVVEDGKFIDYSRYAFQLDQYLEWFPRDQILVVASEELRSDRQSVLRRVLEFLGVEAAWAPRWIRREFHAGGGDWKPRRVDLWLRRLPGVRRLRRALPGLEGDVPGNGREEGAPARPGTSLDPRSAPPTRGRQPTAARHAPCPPAAGLPTPPPTEPRPSARCPRLRVVLPGRASGGRR
jgi:hypothetical protein